MSDRPCTCHPDDNPPVPCPQKFTLSECRAAAPAPCIGSDPFCPCQDGDLCHYKDSPDGKTKAMAAPAPEPVAWMTDAPWGRSVSIEKPDFGKAEWKAPMPKLTPLYAHPAPVAAPAPETVAWMIVEPGCEYGPTFGTENAAWSALTKAPPGSELVELVRRKA